MPSFDIPAHARALRRQYPLTPRLILLGIGALLAIVVLIITSYILFAPPRDFPAGQLVEFSEDATVGEMGAQLESINAVRSAFIFKMYARLTFQDRDLASGMYVFEKPLGVAVVVHRMAQSQHGITPARITLTEGMTNEDMALTLQESITSFDSKAFLELASTSEGYLFPDTYFFKPSTTPEEAFTRMREHFDEKITEIKEYIREFGRPLEEVVIMASLLEREAQTEEEMRIIAGILWKRLAMDMPLQVDAPFGYVRGENGYTPTATDLASDSAYNTYRNTGLTPTPIANPGMTALRAAVTPTETEYLYYLTGRDGKMYYGRTFDEHRENRRLYLD